jgi:hypothetical protein
VDRVVASIGNLAITQSDVVQEYRFETFVADGRIPTNPPSETLFRTVESRLIDQRLLEQQLRDYPADFSALREKAVKEMNTIRNKFRDPGEFAATLSSIGMTAAVEPQEIEEYYRKTLLPQLAKSTTERPPPLSQVQDKIREILVQQKINHLLAEWLAELKREQHVRVFGS